MIRRLRRPVSFHEAARVMYDMRLADDVNSRCRQSSGTAGFKIDGRPSTRPHVRPPPRAGVSTRVCVGASLPDYWVLAPRPSRAAPWRIKPACVRIDFCNKAVFRPQTVGEWAAAAPSVIDGDARSRHGSIVDNVL